MLYGIVPKMWDYDLMGGIRGNGKTASMTLLMKQLYFDQGIGIGELRLLADLEEKGATVEDIKEAIQPWCKEVYTNYWTSFSYVFEMEDIGDLFSSRVRNAVIGIDELSIFANSYDHMRGDKPGTFLLTFIKQSRKKECDFLFTDQRFKEIHKRIRIQTDDLILPTKYHYDGEICELDRCKKDHYFTIESTNYEMSGGISGFPALAFQQSDVIDLYDTNEVVR